MMSALRPKADIAKEVGAWGQWGHARMVAVEVRGTSSDLLVYNSFLTPRSQSPNDWIKGAVSLSPSDAEDVNGFAHRI
jgi:hypothetical protein